jgi:hypothetical protein
MALRGRRGAEFVARRESVLYTPYPLVKISATVFIVIKRLSGLFGRSLKRTVLMPAAERESNLLGVDRTMLMFLIAFDSFP